ncbi:MAG: hypothetical protein Q9225_004251 [Loekoesia sp. 1 TL-2023]
MATRTEITNPLTSEHPDSAPQHASIPFSSLPLDPNGPPGNAWRRFGAHDQLGTLNLLTPAVVAAAASKEIRTGVRISLDWLLSKPAFPGNGREPMKHEIRPRGYVGRVVNDDVLTFNTQCSSQWDGLRHYSVGATLQVAEWLWENGFAAVAGDAVAWECAPLGMITRSHSDGLMGKEEYHNEEGKEEQMSTLHQWLIAGWGRPIGEMFDLEELATHCEREGRWSFFLSSIPLKQDELVSLQQLLDLSKITDSPSLPNPAPSKVFDANISRTAKSKLQLWLGQDHIPSGHFYIARDGNSENETAPPRDNVCPSVFLCISTFNKKSHILLAGYPLLLFLDVDTMPKFPGRDASTVYKDRGSGILGPQAANKGPYRSSLRKYGNAGAWNPLAAVKLGDGKEVSLRCHSVNVWGWKSLNEPPSQARQVFWNP